MEVLQLYGHDLSALAKNEMFTIRKGGEKRKVVIGAGECERSDDVRQDKTRRWAMCQRSVVRPACRRVRAVRVAGP